MIHLYYGNGKGKTSAAAGLALRCRGHGLPVVFAQFLKGGPGGEPVLLEQQGVRIFRQGVPLPFTFQMTDAQKRLCKTEQERVFRGATEAARALDAGLLVLDEYVDALETGMLDNAARVFLEETAASGAPYEIVVTGHSAPPWLARAADYITEFKKHKHPFDAGIAARKGIEF